MDQPNSWAEDDIVHISALEHWSYCPRQCALIEIEQTFDENLFTLRGARVHRLAHEEGGSIEDGQRVVRGMTLWSDRLGLRGKADVVEFGGLDGRIPYPVEYKAGATRDRVHETLQLAAQALCLEEMLGVAVPAGAIYAHGSRKRQEIMLGADLRARVEAAVAQVRALLRGTRLPPAPNDARCPKCSLYDACLPDVAASRGRIRVWQAALFRPEDDA